MLDNRYFQIGGDLSDNNFNDKKNRFFGIVEDLNNSAIVYDRLINQNSYLNDLRVLEIFLNIKKEKDISAESFMYAYSLANVNLDVPLEDFVNNMSQILNIDVFDISGNKMGINGFTKLNDYDYRITLENSSKIRLSDIQYLLQTFNKKAKENGVDYGLKFEPNTTDVIIFYIKEDKLELIINILEDLKNNDYKFNEITSRFGNQKPFTASIDNNSFYGVSMGTDRIVSNNLKGFLALGKTFTEYTASLIDKAYDNLLNKYRDISKITSTELYEMMILLHKNNYGYSLHENFPLWMNKDNYELYCVKKKQNDLLYK